ncbi:MAG: hypothetical protein K0V04_02235, partial [Deltaproteobacteria bacterium]|nr:hypothetical protein [Deltaproteobacteria bacterium]
PCNAGRALALQTLILTLGLGTVSRLTCLDLCMLTVDSPPKILAPMANVNPELDEAIVAKLGNTSTRTPTPGQFKAALTQLAQNVGYREQATQNPQLIVKDFTLSLKELSALRAVAAMSGADVDAIDHVTAATISQHAEKEDAADWDISCCSCCCCCCGETAGSPLVA